MIKIILTFICFAFAITIQSQTILDWDGVDSYRNLPMYRSFEHTCYGATTTLPSSTGIKEETFWIVPSWMDGQKIDGIQFIVNDVATSGTDYVIRLTILHDATEIQSDLATFTANGDNNFEIVAQDLEIKQGDRVRIEVVTNGSAIPDGLFYILLIKY